MSKDTDLIKAKLNIVDFLRSYMTLTPAGKSFKALCPFHQEKTPSFIVSPERGSWHCFGCGEGGDVITFVMKYDNLEFPEALRFLAERAGVEIRSLNPAEQREFGILYDLHESARDFYREELKKNKAAHEYLVRRGLTEETIDEFGLGYAPGGEALTLHLIKAGFDVHDVVRAGLASKNVRGLHWDRFQRRIVFPISNAVGKVVAFTGRIADENDPQSKDMPKYLNSPETPIFNKSKILYGFDRAKNSIAEERLALIVEGQMDFLAVWQSGVHTVIAVSGTGLTTQHLEKVRRLADTVVMSFDNDEAGVKALERSLETLLTFDFYVKVLDLGSFKDPAEALEKDKGFISRALQSAAPAYKRLFSYYFSDSRINDLAHKKRTVHHLLEKIKILKSATEKTEWLKDLSRHSGISESTLLEELEYVAGPETSEAQETKEHEKPLSRYEMILERLFVIAFTREEFLGILREHKKWLPAEYAEMLDNPKSERRIMLEMQSGLLEGKDRTDIKEEFNNLLKELELIFLKKEREAAQDKVKAAGAKGDEALLAEALKEFNTLSQKINTLNSSY